MLDKLRTLVALTALLFAGAGAAVPVEGTRIMISAPSPYAVDAGKAIAAAGGNLVDVAVAVGLALTVTNPSNASLGGGGFALLRMGGAVEVLDFRETAPAATAPDFYLGLERGASWDGATAIGVPGVAAGLWAMHQRHGKLDWAELFPRAIGLAQDGIAFSGTESRFAAAQALRFNAAGRRHFYAAGERAYRPGEILRQPALAQALMRLRDAGADGFYRGDVARDIAATVQAAGGVITAADLAAYRVRWLEPLVTEFAGHRVYLMPPPSSGGAVIHAALDLIERVGLAGEAPLGIGETHLLAEVFSRAFRGRALLGDPDFHVNPLERILAPAYLEQMARSIDRARARRLEPLLERPRGEPTETTHFSVLDADGNAVALTVTLNGSFGSGIVSERFGISLNNEMDDFTTRPGEANAFGLVQGLGNVVEPGKRPLSSMSPTLVEKDGRIVMALGAAGGPRIISSVVQTLYRVLVTGLDIDRALQFPRLHHQFLPAKLYLGDYGFAPEVIDGLRQKGHDTVVQPAAYLGRVKAVRVNELGYLEAAWDRRSEGAAGGY